MVPGQYDITLVQGKSFSLELDLTDQVGAPIDCTGWDANLQMGTGPTATGGVIFATARALNADGNVLVGTISHVGAPTDGKWEVFIPAQLLEEAPVGDQRWDIDFIPPSGAAYKSEYVYGIATVLDRITVL
jgi:hypothetical protein